ncbi:hypothetical protein [Luteimonas aquatica]|uniref:hypothetical protein n=1 Tax=Luteimonas aquatica TaxID=450364 RepID=UPI001F59A395|nr:hypothetical protein [Luteimonas aquatica]
MYKAHRAWFLNAADTLQTVHREISLLTTEAQVELTTIADDHSLSSRAEHLNFTATHLSSAERAIATAIDAIVSALEYAEIAYAHQRTGPKSRP